MDLFNKIDLFYTIKLSENSEEQMSNSSKIEKALNLKLHPDYANIVNEKGHIDPLKEYGLKKNVDEHAIIYGHGNGTPDYYSAIKETLAARKKSYWNQNLHKNMSNDEVVIGDHLDGDIINSSFTVNPNGHVHRYHASGDGKTLISKDFNKFVKAYKNPTSNPMFDDTDYSNIDKFQDKYSKYGKIKTRMERGLAKATGSLDSFNDHYEKHLLDPKKAKAYKYALKQHLKSLKNK